MAYEVVMPYHLHMPSYFLETFTEYPFLVDLEGVEPSSKRGSHTLSTCLSSPEFSCIDKTEATNLYLIL